MPKRSPHSERERISAGQQWFSFELPAGVKFDVVAPSLSAALRRLRNALRRHAKEAAERTRLMTATCDRLIATRQERLRIEYAERLRLGLVPLDEQNLFGLPEETLQETHDSKKPSYTRRRRRDTSAQLTLFNDDPNQPNQP